MRNLLQIVIVPLTLLALSACQMAAEPEATDEMGTADYERGPNNGRMLRDGTFAVELAIFETGVPPEFRAWITDNSQTVPPSSVDLYIALSRLGSTDEISFAPQGPFLRSNFIFSCSMKPNLRKLLRSLC